MNNSEEEIKNLKKKIQEYENSNNTESTIQKRSSINIGFRISTEIVAALVVGVGIGLIVDNYFETRPFGLIIFFILGAFAGFLNVYRVMRRIVKR